MSDSNKKRLLVIGLDGGTYDLLLPYANHGLMPHLKQLLAESAWGNLSSTIPPFTASAWSSYSTGVNPGQHGVLQFNRYNRYEYGHEPIGFADADMLPKTIWEFMSEAGLSVGVVNVPLTYPVRPVNGYMLSGMMTPSTKKRIVYPRDYRELIGEDYQFDVKFVWDDQTFRNGEFPEKPIMLAEIRAVMLARFETLRKLMQAQSSDFLMFVVTATDRLNHFFWEELLDLAEGQAPSPIHASIKEILSELDDFIGELMGLYAKENDYLMLMSDHGFGPSPTRRLNINVVLRDLGMLAERERAGLADLEYWRVRLGRVPFLKRIARAVLPQSTQTQVTNMTRQISGDGLIDWGNSQAFFESVYFQTGGIVINTVGEMRLGCVMPGREYEACRNTIINALNQLRHPDEDRPLFKWVARREEIFRGGHLLQIPDILFELDPDFVGSPAMAGSDYIEPEPPFRSGEHQPAGIFALRGSAIEAQASLEGLNLIDLPSTILYLLDLPVPTYFEGTVLSQLFTETYQAQHPIAPLDTPFVQIDIALGEKAGMDIEVEARLRGLGYIE